MNIKRIRLDDSLNSFFEYHVIDQGIIHAFYSLEEAKDYVDFAKNPKEYMQSFYDGKQGMPMSKERVE